MSRRRLGVEEIEPLFGDADNRLADEARHRPVHRLDRHAEIVGDIGLRHAHGDVRRIRIGPRAAFKQRQKKLRHFGFGFSLAEKRNLAARARQLLLRHHCESGKNFRFALQQAVEILPPELAEIDRIEGVGAIVVALAKRKSRRSPAWRSR